MRRHHKKTIDEEINDEIQKDIQEVKREWRHFVKFKDENRLLFAAFVIVVTSLVIIVSADIINRSSVLPIANGSQQADPNLVLSTLETGNNREMEVRVSNVSENNKPELAFAYDPLETMLIATISVKNLTSKAQSFIPVNIVYVRGEDGSYAQLHPSTFVTNKFPDGYIQPGQTVTGQVSFAILKAVGHPKLYIDTGWSNLAPMVFDLFHTPEQQ